MRVMQVFADKGKKKLIYVSGKETGKVLTIRDMSVIALNELDLKYGTAVDTRNILRDTFGITNTEKSDPTGIRILTYEKLVRMLAEDILTCLKYFGFKADKKKKLLFVTGEDEELVMNHNGGNIVYTNYPWTIVSKAIYAVMEGVNAMKGEHEEGVDVSRWKEDFSEEYRYWKIIEATKKAIAEELENSLAESFDEEAANIIAGINSNMQERHDVYSKLQPKNYGVYPKY